MVSKEHYSGSVNTNIEQTYNYFSDFEQYKERYKRYCVLLEIDEKTDNTIKTSEMWNITVGTKFDHAKVNVVYTLFPPTKIKYEIFKDGEFLRRNEINFEKRGERTGVKASFVSLDMLSMFHPYPDPVYMKMVAYFIRQNSIQLEGKRFGYVEGDLCPFCDIGRLDRSPKKEITETRKECRTIEYFECDRCEKECQSATLEF